MSVDIAPPLCPHIDADRRAPATQFDHVPPHHRRRRAVPQASLRHDARRGTASGSLERRAEQQFLEMQFTAQKSHYEEYCPDCEFLVIEMEGRPIGRLYVDRGR